MKTSTVAATETREIAEVGERLASKVASMGRVVRQQPSIMIGLGTLATVLLLGLYLPLPYSPTDPDPSSILESPSADHWFGTDANGFDVFSRTIAAATRDLPLALIGTLASVLVGVPLGLIASTKTRSAEWLMRGLDVFQAFPLVIIALAVVTLTGNRLENVILAIVIINAPRFVRLIRSETLALRESRFIEAARAVGASRTRILWRHLLPNVIGVVAAQVSLAAALSIVTIASLSFLGVGVSPPDPSWGSMIQSGARQMTTGQWWPVVFPGIMVILTVASFNLLADGIEAASDKDDAS